MDDQKQEDNLEKQEDNDGCGWAVVIVLIVLAVIALVVYGSVRFYRWIGKTLGSGYFGIIACVIVLNIVLDIILLRNRDK